MSARRRTHSNSLFPDRSVSCIRDPRRVRHSRARSTGTKFQCCCRRHFLKIPHMPPSLPRHATCVPMHEGRTYVTRDDDEAVDDTINDIIIIRASHSHPPPPPLPLRFAKTFPAVRPERREASLSPMGLPLYTGLSVAFVRPTDRRPRLRVRSIARPVPPVYLGQCECECHATPSLSRSVGRSIGVLKVAHDLG